MLVETPRIRNSATARRAYPGPPIEAALARLRHAPLIPTSLPGGWSGLLMGMLAMRPEERLSARAVFRRLQSLMSDGRRQDEEPPTEELGQRTSPNPVVPA